MQTNTLPLVCDERSFRSAALSREMRYSIVFPAGYAEGHRRYPVLYLLHGWNGDHRNWVTLTNLLHYAATLDIIIVAPEGRNSWYVNSESSPIERFHDYIFTDLIAEIDATYRTIAAPHRRAIAGLSMGGYGSLLLAMRHPELFEIAGSISGAFDAPRGIERILPDVAESIEAAYAHDGSHARKENDVFRLAEHAPASLFPYFYLCCGSQDALARSNRQLVTLFTEQKIAFEYHEYPGDHSWHFWDESLPQLLSVIAKRIAHASTR